MSIAALTNSLPLAGNLIPQREHFNGAELLSPAWELRKGQKRAACDVWSHQFGSSSGSP